MNNIIYDPSKGLEYIDVDGHSRYLASKPDTTGKMKSLPKFADHFQVLDKKDWFEVDRRAMFAVLGTFDQNGHGCHSADTEILTSNGWVKWSEYNWSDAVGTMNPITGFLEYQNPTAKHVYDYSGEMLFSENRRVNFALTPNHRMYVRKWDERARTLSDEYTFQEAGKLGWYVGLPSSTSGFTGVDIGQISVPGGKEFVGDDFIALLALIASDGWAGGTENTKNRVQFVCFKDERYLEVASLAKRVGFQEEPNRKGSFFTSDPVLANWVRTYCYTGELGAQNKCVPSIVKEVCTRQVEIFIHYFGDKDFDNRNGGRRFYSVSKRLIDDLQELLLRIGSRGSIFENGIRESRMKDGRTITGKHTAYTLNEASIDRLCIDRKKHIVSDYYKGQVYCATVPNGLLVTRRDNDILVSGNSCVGNGWAMALSKARMLAGMSSVLLSPAWWYSLINGNSDNGAIISDGIEAGINIGTCKFSTVGQDPIYQSRMPSGAKAEAARFKIAKAYQVTSYADIITALLMPKPMIPVYGYQVGNNFERTDQYGVAGHDRGPGNHCNHADGVKLLADGRYVLDDHNSWNASWGPFGNGRVYIDEDHLFGGGDQADVCIIEAAIDDPNDTTNPPNYLP